MPLYQLLIAFVFFVGFAAVLKVPNLAADGTDLALLSVAKDAFPQWFVGLIGSAGMLCALVPGSMLLIASATTVAKNIVRGVNPSMSRRDARRRCRSYGAGDRARPAWRSCSRAGRRS